MVKCDGCWLFGNYENAICEAGGQIECRPLKDVGTYDNAWVFFSNNCPLLEIKLKDGTIFRPEVIDE